MSEREYKPVSANHVTCLECGQACYLRPDGELLDASTVRKGEKGWVALPHMCESESQSQV